MDIFSRSTRWLTTLFRLQGSVFPRILPRILLFCAISLVMAFTYKEGLWADSENFKALTNNVACNLVLGLLLVFRTNTAYERYWSGRQAWGTLVIATRNLMREIQIGIDAPTDEAKEQKEQALKRLLGFAIATKCYLRKEEPAAELAKLLDADDIKQVENATRPPQLMTFWLSHYLKQQQKNGYIDNSHRANGNDLVDQLVAALSGCERIVKTPMPISYQIYLKRLTVLYCVLLPVGIVEQLGWWTPVAIALVSFVLLGIEEIGNEIENPFCYGFNDLKLDDICDTLTKDVQSTLAFGADGILSAEPILIAGKEAIEVESADAETVAEAA